jgi:hypothetical protein
LRFVEALPRASIWESNKQLAKSAMRKKISFGGNKKSAVMGWSATARAEVFERHHDAALLSPVLTFWQTMGFRAGCGQRPRSAYRIKILRYECDLAVRSMDRFLPPRTTVSRLIFFETIGIKILAKRDFADRDVRSPAEPGYRPLS